MNFISILIPLYNGIEFLEESLNSVKNQTYTKWEVIIGINGYEKDSDIYKRAKLYETSNIKVIDYFNINNKSKCLNKMILDAKYDIICLLDVDDKWDKNKLEEQINIKKNYDVVGTWCKYFGENNIIPPLPKYKINELDFLRMNPIINSSCMLNKKDCYWDENNITGLEDYDLWLKLNFIGKSFYNIPKILTYHRIHKTSYFNNNNNNYVNQLVKKWSIIYFQSEKFRNLIKI